MHGFSTRMGGVSAAPFDSLNLGFFTEDCDENTEENRKRFFRSLAINSDAIAVPRQVHDNHVAVVKKQGIYAATDGVITNIPGIALIVQVADCLPVFLYDPVRKVIGLVHAGWRGSAKEIASKTVSVLSETYESKPENIQAFLGPSIGPCCYTVGSDVSGQFPKKYCENNRLDIWHVNRDQLLSAGLLDEHIETSRLCTCCHPEWFFSHRHSGGKTGRMMAVLSLIDK